MHQLDDFDSFSSYIGLIEELYGGTGFEGISDVLRDHQHAVKFFITEKDNMTLQFIGSQEDLLREGAPINGEKVIDIVKESDEIRMIDVMRTAKDIIEFRKSCISDNFHDWDSLIQDLHQTLVLDVTIDVFREHLEDKLDDVRQGKIEEHEHLLEMIDRDDSGLKPLKKMQLKRLKEKHDTDSIKQSKQEFIEMGYLELLELVFESRMDEYTDFLDSYTFGDNTPSSGDYIIHETAVGESISTNVKDVEKNGLPDIDDIDFGGVTRYRVILKCTGIKYEENNGFEVPIIQYEVIAYDNELLDEYPEHWVVAGSTIEPYQWDEDEFSVREENPLGDVETKL